MEIMKQMFSSKTRFGRVMRTFLQAFIGILGAVTTVLTVPEIYSWFAQQSLVVQVGGISAVVTGVAVVQNYAKVVWEKVKDL